jgi:hypothetical protein
MKKIYSYKTPKYKGGGLTPTYLLPTTPTSGDNTRPKATSIQGNVEGVDTSMFSSIPESLKINTDLATEHLDNLPTTTQGAGGPAVPWGQIGQLAGGVATQIGMSDGTYDPEDAGIASGLSMAGQGASMGMAFGPIGAGVGAIVGGVGGFFLAKSQRKKQMEKERKVKEAGIDSKIAGGRANDAVKSAAIMAQYPQDGVKGAGYFAKYGGIIPTQEADYTVEGGEVMMAPNGNPPKTDKHGEAAQIGENMFKFTGDTHDAESGGIGVAGGNTEFATQTNQVLNSGFVFSDRLKTDATNYLKDI